MRACGACRGSVRRGRSSSWYTCWLSLHYRYSRPRSTARIRGWSGLPRTTSTISTTLDSLSEPAASTWPACDGRTDRPAALECVLLSPSFENLPAPLHRPFPSTTSNTSLGRLSPRPPPLPLSCLLLSSLLCRKRTTLSFELRKAFKFVHSPETSLPCPFSSMCTSRISHSPRDFLHHDAGYGRYSGSNQVIYAKRKLRLRQQRALPPSLCLDGHFILGAAAASSSCCCCCCS